VRFCPKCQTRLAKDVSGFSCHRCGYKESEGGQKVVTTVAAEDKAFEVLEGPDQSTLPTIEIDCEKCDNDKAVWWMLQTRSADEPTTQFYRCTECSHTWRDYS